MAEYNRLNFPSSIMVRSGFPSESPKKVALVTSGLGTAYGGIGVVANSIKIALEPYCKVSIWQHPPFWPRPLRIAKIAAHVLLGSQSCPDLVIYDHVLHLAVLHAMIRSSGETPTRYSFTAWRFGSRCAGAGARLFSALR